MKRPIPLAYRLLLVWLAARAVNLFLLFVGEHSALHTEARLLVQNLCDTTHNRRITGAIINCNQARQLSTDKSFAVSYALEKTLRTIFWDCWFTATSSLASLVQLMGLITTLAFTSILCLQHMVLSAQRINHARSMYGESYAETLGLGRRPPPVVVRRGALPAPDFGDDYAPAPAADREKFD
jgi:hypothetical protein